MTQTEHIRALTDRIINTRERMEAKSLRALEILNTAFIQPSPRTLSASNRFLQQEYERPEHEEALKAMDTEMGRLMAVTSVHTIGQNVLTALVGLYDLTVPEIQDPETSTD